MGSVLVQRLLQKGYKVRVLDAGYFGHDALNEVRDRIELVEGDVRTCPKDIFRGVQAVAHLAGFSNDPTAEYRPEENFSVNVDGTARTVALAKEARVPRFVFASSCSVYYTTNIDNNEKTEEQHIDPRAPYSLSKYQAEQIVSSARNTKFSPVILRKGTIYGHSPRMRYDLVVNTMLKDAYVNGRMILHLGGRMWRPLLDVRDAADAYICALEHPALEGIYNVVGVNILVSDLAETIARILREDFGVPVAIEKQDVGVSRSYRVSGTKFAASGFTPSHSLREAVGAIWRDLANGGKNPHDDQYYNIRVFEKIFSSKI